MKKILDFIQSVLLILFIIFLFVVLPGGYIIMAICGLIKNPRGLVELIAIAMICASIFFAYKYYKNLIDKKVRERASWWLAKDSSDILAYIQKECVGIESEYLITNEFERKTALEIISAFQEESKTKFIKGYYTVNREYAKMRFSEYFMLYFEQFLAEHDEYNFNGNRLYIEKSRERYGEDSYDVEVKCTITDYGMVFRKLHHMAVWFCEKSTYLNKYNDYYSNGLKEILDTKEITFWYHC